MSLRARSNERAPLTGEAIINQYFKCLGNKDLDGILDLFDYDAVIYEPFSKMQGLRGHSQIEPFLKVAMMANSNLKRAIKIENMAGSDKITAVVVFEKGSKARGRFTFEFTRSDGSQKIRSLRIEFP